MLNFFPTVSRVGGYNKGRRADEEAGEVDGGMEGEM